MKVWVLWIRDGSLDPVKGVYATEDLARAAGVEVEQAGGFVGEVVYEEYELDAAPAGWWDDEPVKSESG